MKKTQLMKQPYTQLFAVFLMFSPLACQKGNDSKAKVQGKKDNGKLTQCTGDQAKQFTDKLAEITARKTELKLQIDAKTLKPEEICKDQKHEQLILSCNDFINKNKDLNCQSDKEVESATAKNKAKTQKVTLKMADLQKACNEYRDLLTSQSCKVSEVAVPAPAPADPSTTTTTTTTTTVTSTTKKDQGSSGSTGSGSGSTNTANAANAAGGANGTPAKAAAAQVEDKTMKSSEYSDAACLKLIGMGRTTQRAIAYLIKNEKDLTAAEKTRLIKDAEMNSTMLLTHALEQGIGKKDGAAGLNAYHARLKTFSTMTAEQKDQLYRDFKSVVTWTNPEKEPKNCFSDGKLVLNQVGIRTNKPKASGVESIPHVNIESQTYRPVYAFERELIMMSSHGGKEGVLVTSYNNQGKPSSTRFFPFKVDVTVAGYRAMNFDGSLWMFVSETKGAIDSFIYDADDSKSLASGQDDDK